MKLPARRRLSANGAGLLVSADAWVSARPVVSGSQQSPGHSGLERKSEEVHAGKHCVLQFFRRIRDKELSTQDGISSVPERAVPSALCDY